MELSNEIADLLDHDVGGHIAVDLVQVGHAGQAILNHVQNPLGGRQQRIGLLVSRFNQLKFLGLEGFVNFRAFVRQLRRKLGKIGVFSLQLFNLHDQFVQILIAQVRRAADVQIMERRLRQEFHLRVKPGRSFGRNQTTQLILERRFGLVQRRINPSNSLNNPRGFGCVLNFKVADDLDEHFQFFARLLHRFLKAPSFRGFSQFCRLRQLRLNSALIRRQ